MSVICNALLQKSGIDIEYACSLLPPKQIVHIYPSHAIIIQKRKKIKQYKAFQKKKKKYNKRK